MLSYRSKSGVLSLDLGDGHTVHFEAYSGAEEGRNNPAMEAVANVGPIPHGDWTIGAPYQSTKTGPFTLPLYRAANEPTPGDRSAFCIHGNNRTDDASHGCIIPEGGLVTRELIWSTAEKLKDYRLSVTAD